MVGAPAAYRAPDGDRLGGGGHPWPRVRLAAENLLRTAELPLPGEV
ncbi:hypothetical protein ACWC2T_02405 [Streptomyces sp. NPDC001393]